MVMVMAVVMAMVMVAAMATVMGTATATATVMATPASRQQPALLRQHWLMRATLVRPTLLWAHPKDR
ncbi:hypothetical protein AS149_28470 [Burkholderia cenocepacia]|nr:hypothetical protein AS149_28470 [Burkholderia cenocepacia]